MAGDPVERPNARRNKTKLQVKLNTGNRPLWINRTSFTRAPVRFLAGAAALDLSDSVSAGYGELLQAFEPAKATGIVSEPAATASPDEGDQQP
jgi:hypothetical protein